jgi:hypothetical protein
MLDQDTLSTATWPLLYTQNPPRVILVPRSRASYRNEVDCEARETMFAMASQLGSRGDAAWSLNPTNLITTPCLRLLTPTLAVPAASGNLHDVVAHLDWFQPLASADFGTGRYMPD